MSNTTTFLDKHRDISEAAMVLQAAMRRAILAVVSHETGARSLARRLSVDKMIGWQAQRIASATDAATVLSALPGERGMAILLKAIEQHGGGQAAAETVRRAEAGLRSVFEQTGATSREIRAIAAGGLDSSSQRRHLEQARKSLYEATVAVRGETVSAEVAAWFVLPSRNDPSLATLLALYMATGLRTLRPLGPRPVYSGTLTYRGKDAWERLQTDPSDRTRLPWLVPEASSPNLDRNTVSMIETQNGRLVIADPDQHPSKSLTLGFADLIEGIGSLYESQDDRDAELGVNLLTPMKRLQVDVFLHESLPPIEPRAALYFIGGLGLEHGVHRELRRVSGEFEGKFVRSPEASIPPQVDAARYLKLIEHGTKLVGHPLSSFRCFRAVMSHPPVYTRAVVKWLLPPAPRGKRRPAAGVDRDPSLPVSSTVPKVGPPRRRSGTRAAPG